MPDTAITRRLALGGAMGAAAIGATAASRPAMAAIPAKLDLANPKQRAVIRAKIMGSTAEETVYTFFRLHIYGYMNDGNLIPFFTMNNLNVAHWKPLPNGNYSRVAAECGVYCRFDTGDILETWENPVTHEERPVWQFIGGPWTQEIGPDGAVAARGEILQPVSLRMEVIGDMIFVASQAAASSLNPITPKDWPKESSGPTIFQETHFLHSAKIADVADPSVRAAPAFCQFQNVRTFHPWMGMGGHPGRTYGKAYGAKVKSLDDLPPGVLAGLKLKTPDFFSADMWKAPHSELKAFMATHRPE